MPERPYYPRRPTLAEILSNTAPSPWTLSAFMAFLSQNHCLETLEFTMDASRYQRRYEDVMLPPPPSPPAAAGAELGPAHHHLAPARPETPLASRRYVQMLWQRLLDAYIVPNGPREVNLPGDVRDRLLSFANDDGPPSPRSLERAVKIVYDLMDESVLVPFLNSLSPPLPSPWPAPPATVYWDDGSGLAPAHVHASERRRRPGDDGDIVLAGADVDDDDDRADHGRHHGRPRRGRTRPDPSPTPSSDRASSSTSSHHGGRHHATGDGEPDGSRRLRSGRNQAWTVGHRHRRPPPAQVGWSTGYSTTSDHNNLTDDSASPSSPGREPMTPPTTPPTGDMAASPRHRTDRTWRKMTDRLGWRKRSSGNLRDSPTPFGEETVHTD